MSNQKITPPNPISPTIPVGTIVAFTGNTSNIPPGWILCNEVGIKSTTNKGYTGPTVPNLDGLTLIGQGSNYSLGETGGEISHTLSIQEMPRHLHLCDNDNPSNPTGANVFIVGNVTADAKGDSVFDPKAQGLQGNGEMWGDIGSTNCTDQTGGPEGSNIGVSSPHNNMQPYYVVYFIMYIGIATRNGKFNPAF